MKPNFLFRMAILFRITWNASGWKYEILPTKVSSESLSDKIHLNISITRSGGLSLYIDLKEDLHDLYVTISLAINYDTEKEYDFEVVKRIVDCCQLFNQSSYAPEVQFFYKTFLDHGHFPVQCPVKKDLYYLEDWKVNPERLSELMPERNALLTVKFSVKEKNRFKTLSTYQLHITVNKIGNTTQPKL